jgi:hypothetical protein
MIPEELSIPGSIGEFLEGIPAVPLYIRLTTGNKLFVIKNTRHQATISL